MSEENVEIVRRAYYTFNRGDVDAAFKAFAPDFEFDMSRAVGFNIDRDVYDLIQFRRLFDEYVGSWESFRLGPDEFLAAGEEMRTEISTKFMRPGPEGIYGEAGLELTDWWTDDEDLYALSLARAV